MRASTQFSPFKLSLQLPEKYILKNGIPLQMNFNSNLQLLGFTIKIKAGSIYQNKKYVAASLVQLLQEGTLHRSAVEIAEQIDYFGAHTEFINGKDFSILMFYVSQRHFQALLPLIFEILTAPAFEESELQRHKETSIQQLAYNLERISY